MINFRCPSHKIDNYQLTEVTLTLETGLSALLPVETELKPEQELVLTLLLPMVVLTVLDLLLKLERAKKEIVQVYWQIIYPRGENLTHLSKVLFEKIHDLLCDNC